MTKAVIVRIYHQYDDFNDSSSIRYETEEPICEYTEKEIADLNIRLNLFNKNKYKLDDRNINSFKYSLIVIETNATFEERFKLLEPIFEKEKKAAELKKKKAAESYQKRHAIEKEKKIEQLKKELEKLQESVSGV